TWHQDISQIGINYTIKQVAQCQSVANTVFSSIISYGLNPSKCLTWTTDNMAYMSGNQKGAVVQFNKKTNLNSTRIGCRMHIIHIVLTNFEDEAFGKLASLIG
ncbi:40221_t:CDS:2, partial [Gigaspora margarita]